MRGVNMILNEKDEKNFIKNVKPDYYMGDYIDAERIFWEYEDFIKTFIYTYKDINPNEIPMEEINKFIAVYPKFVISYRNLIASQNTPITMVYEISKKPKILRKISVKEYKRQNWGTRFSLAQFNAETLELIEIGKKLFETFKKEIVVGKNTERKQYKKSLKRKRETGQGTNATMNRISQNIKAVTKQSLGKFGKL